MSEVTILLSLIGFGITIIIGILSWLVKRLLDLEDVISPIKIAVFGDDENGRDGIISQLEALESQAESNRRERRREHKEVKDRLEDQEFRTRMMLESLSESESVDVSVDLSEIGGTLRNEES